MFFLNILIMMKNGLNEISSSVVNTQWSLKPPEWLFKNTKQNAQGLFFPSECKNLLCLRDKKDFCNWSYDSVL